MDPAREELLSAIQREFGPYEEAVLANWADCREQASHHIRYIVPDRISLIGLGMASHALHYRGEGEDEGHALQWFVETLHLWRTELYDQVAAEWPPGDELPFGWHEHEAATPEEVSELLWSRAGEHEFCNAVTLPQAEVVVAWLRFLLERYDAELNWLGDVEFARRLWSRLVEKKRRGELLSTGATSG